MLIARNTVVTLDYSVADLDGASIDEGANPLVYLHGGYGGIFDRIEEELQGKAVGDALEVRLEPEDINQVIANPSAEAFKDHFPFCHGRQYSISWAFVITLDE